MWKDSETEIDFLDFDYLIHTLKDIISDEALLPSSIGVYGDWGSGKSSLIKMSMAELDKEEDTVCLIFNGWLFEGYEDAKTALLGSILDVIQEERTLGEKAQICISQLYKSIDKLKLLKNGVKYGTDFLLTGGVGTIADITINNIVSKVKSTVGNIDGQNIKNQLKEGAEALDNKGVIQAIQDELNNKEIREDIKKFQENFGELLKDTKIERLVIFIDELDRCSPDTILDTLEAIRLFLFVGNVAFIIGADERHISYAVKRKFDKIEGQQIDIGKEYLEKIIQYPIRIPRLNAKEVEFYITCLLFEEELNAEEFQTVIEFLNKEKREKFLDFNLNYSMLNQELPHIAEQVKESLLVSRQLSSVLAEGLNGNPRHCKRFLNSLVMREKMATYKGLTLDRKVLAKIMLLEYFKVPLFKKIAKLQFGEQEKTQELKLLEDQQLDDSCELKIWKDDLWVQHWSKTEPKLADIDLRPYFYFSRETLDEKFDSSIKKLSPKAKDVLEKLLNKSQAMRKQALQSADEINDYEAAEILDTILGRIMADTSKDLNIFKSFIEWSKTKESLYVNALDNLSSLSGKRIPFGAIPLIKDFMIKSNKKTEILAITKKWAEEDGSIATVIQKTFAEK